MTTPYTKKTRRDSTTVEAILQRNVPMNGRGGVQAEIGFAKLGEQEPYFHVLAGAYEPRERTFSACADHILFAEKFPEVVHLAKWHLVSLRSGPMHYEANARYWLEKVHGVSKWNKSPGEPDPMAAFRSTVVWGAVATDETQPMPDLVTLSAWLADRKSALMAKFKAEIESAFPGMWTLAEGL